jgi:hypothetical protein
MDLLAKANSPEADLKAFMNGQGNRDDQVQKLKTQYSPIRGVWNRDFELLRGIEN